MIEAIHPSIVQAICRIQQSVDSVAKSQRNSHGGYNFASTDDIYAALTRKMGEVGLALLTLEESCEIKRIETTDKDGKPKISQWAHMIYSFVIATSEATWTDKRATRTLYIQVTGPQTFQAAQSYAEKSFLRSLFKLPTGDMDLDSMPQAEYEDEQQSLAAIGTSRKRKSSYSAKKDGTQELFKEIHDKVREAPTADILQQVRTLYADEWETMPRQWLETLEGDYETRMIELRGRMI